MREAESRAPNCVERSRMPHLDCRAKKASKTQTTRTARTTTVAAIPTLVPASRTMENKKKYVTRTAATKTFRKTNGNCEIYKCSLGEVHENFRRCCCSLCFSLSPSHISYAKQDMTKQRNSHNKSGLYHCGVLIKIHGPTRTTVACHIV